MNKDLYSAIKNRRSIYGISKEEIVSKEKIQEVINHAVMHAPSAFNSQSARVVILFGDNHDLLWDITRETLRKTQSAERFVATDEKLNSFKNGYGTVLFFEEMSIVEGLQQQFPKAKDNFPIWSQNSSGMVQYIVWTSLEQEGLGASLQHYNPLIDEKVKKQWGIPASWKLSAEMPFGKPTAEPKEKEFQPIEMRVKVFK
ncbi:MAG: nitroreductase [Clostridia bacterium]|nr:nitroreductase [Clostridia bacterium]